MDAVCIHSNPPLRHVGWGTPYCTLRTVRSVRTSASEIAAQILVYSRGGTYNRTCPRILAVAARTTEGKTPTFSFYSGMAAKLEKNNR